MQMKVFTTAAGQKLANSRGVAPRPDIVDIPRTASAQPRAQSVQHTALSQSLRSLHRSLRSSSSTGRVAAAAAPAAAAAAAAQSTSDSLRSCAVALAKVADDTKALDISVLHVEPVVSWTSYMVLCTVMSKPQLLAVLSRMEDAAAEHGLEKQNSAGSSQWEVLDFGSIVCHVFTSEQREYYNLDDFYALAEEVELPFVSATAAVNSGFEQQQFEAGSGSGVGGLWSKSL